MEDDFGILDLVENRKRTGAKLRFGGSRGLQNEGRRIKIVFLRQRYEFRETSLGREIKCKTSFWWE
jgi:hypothetical protein